MLNSSGYNFEFSHRRHVRQCYLANNISYVMCRCTCSTSTSNFTTRLQWFFSYRHQPQSHRNSQGRHRTFYVQLCPQSVSGSCGSGNSAVSSSQHVALKPCAVVCKRVIQTNITFENTNLWLIVIHMCILFFKKNAGLKETRSDTFGSYQRASK
jgi:hypothetical protein